MGYSIPFWAGHHAATYRPGGSNLNLPATTTYVGRRGMCWDELDKAISEYLARYPLPNFLLPHLGSNDLTTPELTGIQLIHKIQCSLYRYNVLLPNTTLIFSSMLAKLYWHGVPPTAVKQRLTPKDLKSKRPSKISLLSKLVDVTSTTIQP